MNGIVSAILVFLVAAAPISELRGSMPLALHVFHFSIPVSVLLSVIGNLTPPFLIIYFLDPLLALMARRSPPVRRFLDRHVVRMRDKVRPYVLRYGFLGLMVFIAIPLPLTGAWTGAVGAVLLGVPRRKALLGVLAGVLVAACIVLLLDTTVAQTLRWWAGV